MKQHPHAEVLRAIADGVPLSTFEITAIENTTRWESMGDGNDWSSWIFYPEKWKVRRKPQHIVVNGFKVPKPLDVMPESSVYWPCLGADKYWDGASIGHSHAINTLARGLAHATKEAAIAHAKAMLGIDPEYFK